jgi:hypothetical protein
MPTYLYENHCAHSYRVAILFQLHSMGYSANEFSVGNDGKMHAKTIAKYLIQFSSRSCVIKEEEEKESYLRNGDVCIEIEVTG